MPQYPPFTTTVVGAHSVPRWYEALDRLVALSVAESIEPLRWAMSSSFPIYGGHRNQGVEVRLAERR
jgi:hypothetical protein